jgi:hypothetical protein
MMAEAGPEKFTVRIMPIGSAIRCRGRAHPRQRDGVLLLSAQVTSLDGTERAGGTMPGTDPEATGTMLAALLRQQGAEAILDQIREPASR